MTQQRRAVLILGGGIAGLTAASHLARQDIDVILVEKGYFLGGQAITYSCKATDKCVKCDACTVEKVLKEISQEPRVSVYLASELESLEENGRFKATIRSRPTFDSPSEQEALAKAYPSCPVPGAILRGYSKNNAPLYAIDTEKLDQLAARRDECFPGGSPNLDRKGETRTVKVDAVLAASGFQPFNPEQKPTFSYGQQENLLSAKELEQIKKDYGRYLRPSDLRPPQRLAFIQCVGSRNQDLGNLWCSQVCCPYALRMAQSIKQESPETEIVVFYMDIQNIGKDSPTFYHSCREDLGFVRNMPVDICPGDDSGLLVSHLDETETRINRERFDMVVLSVGITPNPDNQELSGKLGIPLNEDGFFETPCDESEAPRFRKGVFAAGTATGPKSIAASMAQAGQAVQDVLKYFRERT